MRISSLEEYGLRCLLALAREGQGKQLSISEIAEMEGLSMPYASKLLSILRKAELVEAVRGRGGGFCISRDPGEITLLDVLTALGGPILDPDHCNRFTGQLDTCVHTIDGCSVHGVLDSLAGYISDLLSQTTLEDLVRMGQANKARRMSIIPAESLLSDSPGPEDDKDKVKKDVSSYKQSL